MSTADLGVLRHDPNLKRWTPQLLQRQARFRAVLDIIEREHGGLDAFTSLDQRGFSVDLATGAVTYTEYAPSAQAVSLVGGFNNIDPLRNPLRPARGAIEGVWTCTVPPLANGECPIPVGSEVAVEVTPQPVNPYLATEAPAPLRRIPAQILLATQTPGERSYRGRMSMAPRRFPLKGLEGDDASGTRPARPSRPAGERVYEAHIGAAAGEPNIMGTYQSFRKTVLPRVVAGHYTTLQLMGIAEHPYYPSFGYQVSSFFAVSSRFGTIQDLMDLIDDAHSRDIRVILDIVHAHASTNEGEGLARFDGSDDGGYFKPDLHPAWRTQMFDFGRIEVVRFLLCNLRFWVERIGVDGFRFDAVTAMLFRDHGHGRSFSGSYDEYFGDIVDDEGVTYLTLANHVVQTLLPGNSTTIAEDVSGFPTLCLPISEGGIGFDYRLALGHPDMWFGLLKDQSDLDRQPLGFITKILSTLMSRRADLGEKSIAYVECHDQSIMGDSPTAQWLFAEGMYDCMAKSQEPTRRVEMAMAWHKMLRFLTHTLGGEGYLNFMGNEFGHPEWLDLPAPHNHYSHDHAYRKWHLGDDPSLRFEQLKGFDAALNKREAEYHWLHAAPAQILLHDEPHQRLVYTRAGLLFVCNLHADTDWIDDVPAPAKGRYENVLDTDEGWYGGTGKSSRNVVAVRAPADAKSLAVIEHCLVPPRTAIIFRPAN